jgi:hypothetical protein
MGEWAVMLWRSPSYVDFSGYGYGYGYGSGYGSGYGYGDGYGDGYGYGYGDGYGDGDGDRVVLRECPEVTIWRAEL